MDGGFPLDVVVAKRARAFQLLARQNETLLVQRDALLVLNHPLEAIDRVRRCDVERDGLSCQGLDEKQHTVRTPLLIYACYIASAEKAFKPHDGLVCAETIPWVYRQEPPHDISKHRGIARGEVLVFPISVVPHVLLCAKRLLALGR